MKRIAVISLTARGRALSCRIAEALGQYAVRRYCFAKHTDADAVSYDDLAALTAQLFSANDALIFVCACGIAVRMTAPFVKDKRTDPAVLVLDDRGRFVIPVLSGHLGGANALAELLAASFGAEAVITTATDIGGQFSPDSFAAANGLLIAEMQAAKEIAAAVLQGERIGLRSAFPCRNLPPELTEMDTPRCGIVIAEDMHETPFSVTLHLIPRNIVLGIGCKKHTAASKIEAAVTHVLQTNGIMQERICRVASIDLKAQEPGLLQFCAQHGLPLSTYSAAELMALTGDFSHSDFVQETTGADNICERSAVLCSGGKLLFRKTALDGVTVAAAEIPVEPDFEKGVL